MRCSTGVDLMARKCSFKIVIVFVLVLILFVNMTIASVAASLEDIQSQITHQQANKNELKNELADLQAKIEAQKKEDAKITAEMAAILAQKQEQATIVEQMLDDLDNIYEQIEGYYNSIQQAEEEYNKALEKFYTRARIMYRYTQYDSLRLFVEAEDILDYANRDKLFSRMMANDRESLKNLVVLKQDLEGKKKIQEQLKVDAEVLLAEKQAVVEAIENNEKIVAEKVAASRKILDILEAQEEAIEIESKRIEKEIKKLQELYNQQTQSYSGLIWPSRNTRKISSYYGMRIHPIYGYWKMHKGIDIGASYGTDILSSADGVVTLVADDKDGYGLYIVVYHGDGISTLYAHCSKIIAKVGQSVKQGQVIALVGDTGASTSPHIHYEVRVNGAHTDPLKYVKP